MANLFRILQCAFFLNFVFVTKSLEFEANKCTRLRKLQVAFLIDGSLAQGSNWSMIQTEITKEVVRLSQKKHLPSVEYGLVSYHIWKRDGNGTRTKCYTLIQPLSSNKDEILSKLEIPGEAKKDVKNECSLSIALLMTVNDKNVLWDSSKDDDTIKKMIIAYTLKPLITKLDGNASQGLRRDPIGDGPDTCENSNPPSADTLKKVIEENKVLVLLQVFLPNGREKIMEKSYSNKETSPFHKFTNEEICLQYYGRENSVTASSTYWIFGKISNGYGDFAEIVRNYRVDAQDNSSILDVGLGFKEEDVKSEDLLKRAKFLFKNCLLKRICFSSETKRSTEYKVNYRPERRSGGSHSKPTLTSDSTEETFPLHENPASPPPQQTSVHKYETQIQIQKPNSPPPPPPYAAMQPSSHSQVNTIEIQTAQQSAQSSPVASPSKVTKYEIQVQNANSVQGRSQTSPGMASPARAQVSKQTQIEIQNALPPPKYAPMPSPPSSSITIMSFASQNPENSPRAPSTISIVPSANGQPYPAYPQLHPPPFSFVPPSGGPPFPVHPGLLPLLPQPHPGLAPALAPPPAIHLSIYSPPPPPQLYSVYIPVPPPPKMPPQVPQTQPFNPMMPPSDPGTKQHAHIISQPGPADPTRDHLIPPPGPMAPPHHHIVPSSSSDQPDQHAHIIPPSDPRGPPHHDMKPPSDQPNQHAHMIPPSDPGGPPHHRMKPSLNHPNQRTHIIPPSDPRGPLHHDMKDPSNQPNQHAHIMPPSDPRGPPHYGMKHPSNQPNQRTHILPPSGPGAPPSHNHMIPPQAPSDKTPSNSPHYLPEGRNFGLKHRPKPPSTIDSDDDGFIHDKKPPVSVTRIPPPTPSPLTMGPPPPSPSCFTKLFPAPSLPTPSPLTIGPTPSPLTMGSPPPSPSCFTKIFPAPFPPTSVANHIRPDFKGKSFSAVHPEVVEKLEEACNLDDSDLPNVQILFLVDGSLAHRSNWTIISHDMTKEISRLVQEKLQRSGSYVEFALASYFSSHGDTSSGGKCYSLLQPFTNDPQLITQKIGELGHSHTDLYAECSLTLALILAIKDNHLQWNNDLITMDTKATRKFIIVYPMRVSSTTSSGSGTKREPHGDGTDTCENSKPPKAETLKQVVYNNNVYVLLGTFLLQGKEDQIGKFYSSDSSSPFRWFAEDTACSIYFAAQNSVTGHGRFWKMSNKKTMSSEQYKFATNVGMGFKEDTIFKEDILKRANLLYLNCFLPEFIACDWEDPPGYNTLGL